jgi:stress-induced morphogen
MQPKGGTMYKMKIESDLFKEKSKVEQHQMVTNILKEEIKEIHGFNLTTLVPAA